MRFSCLRLGCACLRMALLGVLSFSAGFAYAQAYPSKPIRIVVPFPAGGSTDIIARILAQRLGDGFGQAVIVENRAGAGGTVGAAAVAKSAPDGYTLLFATSGTNALAQNLYADLGYRAESDFSPITTVVTMPLFVVVASSSPFKSLGELLAAGKQSGNLNYASPGSGTLGHLGGELLNMLAGTKFVHIPYKGTAPGLTALLAGDVSLYVMASADALPQMKQARLRALAIASAERSPLAPNVPTTAEAGLEGLAINVWYGLLAPANTPRTIVDRLNQEVVKILGEQAFRDRLLDFNAEAAPTTPEAFAALVKADVAKYATIVKASGVKVE